MAQITELSNTGDLDTPAGAAADLSETAGDDQATPNGPLLDLKEAAAARRVLAMRKLRSRSRKRRAAEALRVIYWRKGYRYVQLTGDEDHGSWKATLPLGSSRQPPNPNKIDRLIRRAISVITADKPVPKAIPERDDDRAIAAAELSTKILKVEGSSQGINLPRLLRRLMDKSCTWRSSFAWIYVDPKGGGHRPLAMLAHPDALHMDQATVDPTTGEPVPEDQLLERFVQADGVLTDQPEQADRQWLPKTKVRMLTPQNVDLLPETADSIEDALGVTMQLYMTLGQLRSMFEDYFEKLPDDQLKKLVAHKPEDWKSYLPRDMRHEWSEPKMNDKGGFDDDAIVWPVFTFYKQCSEYPCGAYVVTVGEMFRPHAEKWCEPVELPDGSTKTEYLEIPVAQCRCLDDDVDDDPMGVALGEKLGPMDEIRATILGYAMDYLFRFGNPQPYLPIGTTVQPKQLLYRTGAPIMIPTGGQPYYEEIPEFPHKITEIGIEMSEEMDDESNLQQAAQGVEAPSVKSGIHAETIVSQANVALSQMKENSGNCYTRICMIMLQLWRVFYDIELQVDYQGEDQSWQRDAWVGSDLGSTKLVEIEAGSFTMQTPQQKQAAATTWMQAGIIKPDAYAQLITNSIAPELGVQTDPDRARVMTQIEAWRRGPSPADTQAFTMYQAQQQQLQQQTQAAGLQAQAIAAQTGQPQPVQAPPQMPPLVLPGDPFATDQLPCDQESDSADVRHRALRRVMPTKAFKKQPQFWRNAFIAEYERMRIAAGKTTLAEQAQMNQQAAQLKLQIAQTPKVDIVDKNAAPETIGADVEAAKAGFDGTAAPAPAAAGPGAGAPPPAHPIANIPPRAIPTAPQHAAAHSLTA